MIEYSNVKYYAGIEKTDTLKDLKNFYPDWVSESQFEEILSNLKEWFNRDDVRYVNTSLLGDKTQFSFSLCHHNMKQTKCEKIYTKKVA